MSQLYVYYKVDASNRPAAIALARRVISALEASNGVQVRLSHRADDPLTIMESYDGVNDVDAFRRQLDRAVTDSGLAALIRGDRHTEHFVPCA